MCSRAQEVVPVAPTPIEVEAYDIDHEVSDQITAVPRRVTRIRTTSEWYGNTTKKDTSVMIRVCHSRSCFLSCMYMHDKLMTESR